MMEDSRALMQKALLIAAKAHAGAYDKGGNPYITHPVFVALNCNTYEEKITALLHDVIEDTDVTLDDLRKEGFPEDIITAVDTVTKKKGQDYFEYLAKVKGNRIARAVKINDIMHNSDLSRIKNVTEKDLERVEKYRKALDYLSKD